MKTPLITKEEILDYINSGVVQWHPVNTIIVVTTESNSSESDWKKTVQKAEKIIKKLEQEKLVKTRRSKEQRSLNTLEIRRTYNREK